MSSTPKSEDIEPAEVLPDASAPTGVNDAVVVRIGRQRYAVPLPGVAEVGRAPHVSHVPGIPAWVAGVVNWRGRILPVLELGPLLGAATVDGHRERLVVLVCDGVRVGLLVDAIEATATLDQQVAPLPVPLPAPATGLVSGHFRRDDGPLAVLDVAGVLGLRDELPRRRSA